MSTDSNDRRSFLKKSIVAGFTASAFIQKHDLTSTFSDPERKNNHLNFLFQGDSITDGNRGRNSDPNHILGHGYAFSIASRLGALYPEKANQFYNRGISGNTIIDLETRWQTDTLDLKPDILSILIGVNDTNGAIKKQANSSIEKFESVFRSLLDQTTKQLPGCLIVLCEPFILQVGRVAENWNEWNDEMQKRQATVKHLAKEYKTIFVPLQNVFNDASQHAPASYWIWDGIHPTYSGHELITREWLKQVGKQLHFIRKIHC